VYLSTQSLEPRSCDSSHLKQVNDHVPLATIANQIASKVSNEAIIERTAGFLDCQLEVIIGLVEFIPEEQVGLTRRRITLSISSQGT